jgi:hypothetical protein
MASTLKPGARAKMKPSTGCFGITKPDFTRHCIMSARCSSKKTRRLTRKHREVEHGKPKQAMEKQESKNRFPTFPQPRRLRSTLSYGIRILRARPRGARPSTSYCMTSDIPSPQDLPKRVLIWLRWRPSSVTVPSESSSDMYTRLRNTSGKQC